MTYDVDAGPPRSVVLQRRVEAVLERIAEELTTRRLVAAALIWVFVHVARNSDADASTSSTAAWLEGVTLADVATVGKYGAALLAWMFVIVVLHELCHWLAFYRFDVDAYWTVNFAEVRGRTVYPFITGGVCWPRHDHASVRLSWTEDAIISLAPLALSVLVAVVVFAYHFLVTPIADPWWVAGWLAFAAGPSPPDWVSLLETPRERWEWLVDFEEGLEDHAFAEGYA